MTSTPLHSDRPNTSSVPDRLGRFGIYGGKYVPETLMPALAELETAYEQYRQDPDFLTELNGLLKDYVGRANPLYFAERLTKHYARPDGSGVQILSLIHI